jgi:putative transposase
MGDAIKKLLKECATKNNFSITEIECEKEHIHLLVNYPPTQSVTNVITKLKHYSTFNFSYLA